MAAETKSEVPVTSGKGARELPASAGGPLEGFDRLFDQLVPRSWLPLLRWDRPFAVEPGTFEGRMPRIDVIDRENEIVVKAEAPGVKKEDVKVSLTGNLLTVRGETRREEKEEKEEYYRCEIARGSFSRTVALPCEVDAGKATAVMTDGMLEITLPKLEQAKKREIRVA
jgi:HSP20 family protein